MRPTKSHEYLFLLSKKAKYFYDAGAVREPHARDWSNGRSGGSLGPRGAKKIAVANPSDPNFRNGHSQWERTTYPEPNPAGRNLRSVWTIATAPYSEAHFATFPQKLVEPCIVAGSRPGDIVLDPFFGTGTVGQVAERLGRKWIGIELNPEYAEMSKKRTAQIGMCLHETE